MVHRRGYAAAAGITALLVALAAPASAGPPDHAGHPDGAGPGAKEVRVVQYNLLDVRTADVKRDDNPRLKELAATIQRIQPDILLLNEITYDEQGAPNVEPGEGEGQNARRFVENYLMVPQQPGLRAIPYETFMAPSNTGIASGFDFDNSGEAVTDYPPPLPTEEDGTPGAQTPGGREYGEDAFGFGIFPGQYAMAVLVRPQFQILEDEVRTFQKFLWKDMPGALLPVDPATGEPWYSEEEVDVFRLSSKSHWDVPVRVPGGEVVHLLASHPTPRGFDGPEDRNGRRNHDEVRFWGDYINDLGYIYDDEGVHGGLDQEASFVIMGDLNNEVEVQKFILDDERVNDGFVPEALEPDPGRDPTGTGHGRIDYVLPSNDLVVIDGWVVGHEALFEGGTYAGSPSDHFPVLVDLSIPKR